MRYLFAAILFAACGDPVPDPHHPACWVGRTCPDSPAAPIDAPIDAVYPSCSAPIPKLPACTCADWLCTKADGGVELVGSCGPPCDGGVDALPTG